MAADEVGKVHCCKILHIVSRRYALRQGHRAFAFTHLIRRPWLKRVQNVEGARRFAKIVPLKYARILLWNIWTATGILEGKEMQRI